MKVLKFGGSSVGTPLRIEAVIDIILAARREDPQLAVVVSAFHGVTDQLVQISRLAASGDETHRELLKKLAERHLDVAGKLLGKDAGSPIDSRRSDALAQGESIDPRRHEAPAGGPEELPYKHAFGILEEWLSDLKDTLHGVYLVRELSARTLDFIMSFGERASTFILSEALAARGIAAEFLDARNVIVTDDNYGAARVDLDATNERIRLHFAARAAASKVREALESLEPIELPIQVVTGFIAATRHNETTTLGRGGSDYTASIIGAALGSAEIQIWTDVDGVMTADPRKVPKAFPVPSLTYEEAMELSHFGAKVIYPPTMQPALHKRIPIRILNTFNPQFAGTSIEEHAHDHTHLVTGVTSISHIALLRVQGSGMVGVAGISHRLFGALSRAHVSVILITQASSEHTICLAVAPDAAARARKAIDDEFALEIKAELVNPTLVERDLCIVSAVGENMAHTAGLAGRLFQALGRNGINITAIAQGSSELNISVVIARGDESKALNAIHDEFFLAGSRSVNVFVVGTGLVGSALLRQIEQHAHQLREKLGLDLRVIAIANSRRMVCRESGIPLGGMTKLLGASKEPGGIDQLVSALRRLNLPNSVVVDCTSSPAVVSCYQRILEASVSIVTPNKKAQSGEYQLYRALKLAARKHNAEFLYETSVGAGLPVIGTLNDLLRSGDRVLGIEAVLSGTLSYIFNSFDGQKPFSRIVRDARDKGYTEPDPRDDLNGLDVARKLLILARESGLPLEMSDVQVENLVPESSRQAASADEFLCKLEAADDYFEGLRARAAGEGRKLCYVAALRDGRAEVTLQRLGPEHPFFSLSGSDNIISFATERYRERPLVVKGPGAGAEVTAAGVFADIIRVGNYYMRG